jgi:hypothetical protein
MSFDREHSLNIPSDFRRDGCSGEGCLRWGWPVRGQHRQYLDDEGWSDAEEEADTAARDEVLRAFLAEETTSQSAAQKKAKKGGSAKTKKKYKNKNKNKNKSKTRSKRIRRNRRTKRSKNRKRGKN